MTADLILTNTNMMGFFSVQKFDYFKEFHDQLVNLNQTKSVKKEVEPKKLVLDNSFDICNNLLIDYEI